MIIVNIEHCHCVRIVCVRLHCTSFISCLISIPLKKHLAFGHYNFAIRIHKDKAETMSQINSMAKEHKTPTLAQHLYRLDVSMKQLARQFRIHNFEWKFRNGTL